MIQLRGMLICVAGVLLGSCGGGGGAGSNPPPATPPPTTNPPAIAYTAGVYPASSTFASQCAVPRTGVDPNTGRAYTDRAGSALAEKHFLRSWTNELYLWFNEVTDRDPASVADVRGFFDGSLTNGGWVIKEACAETYKKACGSGTPGFQMASSRAANADQRPRLTLWFRWS